MSGATGRGAFGVAFVLHLHGLERAPDAKSIPPDNYPPYDLVLSRGDDGAPDRLRLVFAVAGFAPDQLEIAVAGDQLLISGEGSGDGSPNHFMHRGIAARRFRRAFRLAPGLDVMGVELDLGLLSVALAIREVDRTSRIMTIATRSQ